MYPFFLFRRFPVFPSFHMFSNVFRCFSVVLFDFPWLSPAFPGFLWFSSVFRGTQPCIPIVVSAPTPLQLASREYPSKLISSGDDIVYFSFFKRITVRCCCRAVRAAKLLTKHRLAFLSQHGFPTFLIPHTAVRGWPRGALRFVLGAWGAKKCLMFYSVFVLQCFSALAQNWVHMSLWFLEQ